MKRGSEGGSCLVKAFHNFPEEAAAVSSAGHSLEQHLVVDSVFPAANSVEPDSRFYQSCKCVCSGFVLNINNLNKDKKLSNPCEITGMPLLCHNRFNPVFQNHFFLISFSRKSSQQNCLIFSCNDTFFLGMDISVLSQPPPSPREKAWPQHFPTSVHHFFIIFISSYTYSYSPPKEQWKSSYQISMAAGVATRLCFFVTKYYGIVQLETSANNDSQDKCLQP